MSDHVYLPWEGWKTDQYIGTGEFGDVYRIVKEAYGKTIYAAARIIKIPCDLSEIDRLKALGIPTKLYYKEILDDLLREISVMESMRGMSNIAIIDDYVIEERKDCEGWILYVKMELLANLSVYLQTYDLDLEQTIKVGVDICSALESYHKKGIIHGSMKPSNIFISRFREFKLGDFVMLRNPEKNMFRDPEQMENEKFYLETNQYRAPEICREKKYNPTTDIYALGMVLYQLLNDGKLPEKESIFPDPLWGGKRIGDILRKACHVDPAQRFQKIEDFKNALLKEDLQLCKKEIQEAQKLDANSFSDDFPEENYTMPEGEIQEEAFGFQNENNGFWGGELGFPQGDYSFAEETGADVSEEQALSAADFTKEEDRKYSEEPERKKKRKGSRPLVFRFTAIVILLVILSGSISFALSYKKQDNSIYKFSALAEDDGDMIIVALQKAYDDESYNGYWDKVIEECQGRGYNLEFRWVYTEEKAEDFGRMLEEIAEETCDMVIIDYIEPCMEQETFINTLSAVCESGKLVAAFDQRSTETSEFIERIRCSFGETKWNAESVAATMDDFESVGLGTAKTTGVDDWKSVYAALKKMQDFELDAFKGMKETDFFEEIGITDEMLKQAKNTDCFKSTGLSLLVDVDENYNDYISMIPQNRGQSHFWIIIDIDNYQISEIVKVDLSEGNEFSWGNYSITYS